MHARLLQWDAEVKVLEARLMEAKADKKMEYQDEIGDLKTKIASARAELKKMSDAGEASWKALKSGLDEAWDNIADGFRNARSKF
jgi:septal ring factor EnvC (AmiA/AmiB activator)